MYPCEYLDSNNNLIFTQFENYLVIDDKKLFLEDIKILKLPYPIYRRLKGLVGVQEGHYLVNKLMGNTNGWADFIIITKDYGNIECFLLEHTISSEDYVPWREQQELEEKMKI